MAVADRCIEATGAVKVKPLEWTDRGLGLRYATTPFGQYAVNNDGYWWFDSDSIIRRGGMAAVQADYERRILSAIEPSPSLPMLVEALEPFAALADIFDHDGGNRPKEGTIAQWTDHRVGDRGITVEHLRAARAALDPINEEQK